MLQIDKENFEKEVVQSDRPVIIDFWGPSCQPCLQLMPEVEKLSEEYQEKVKIVKINSAENRRLCIDHHVMGLPTFLVFQNGQETTRLTGQELTSEDINNLIDNICAKGLN